MLLNFSFDIIFKMWLLENLYYRCAYIIFLLDTVTKLCFHASSQHKLCLLSLFSELHMGKAVL
jgi:hypothetical protein